MDAGCQVTQNIYARTAKVLREGLNDCCQRSSPLLRSANLGRVRQILELTSSLLAKVSCEKAEKRMEGTLPTPITSRCSWSLLSKLRGGDGHRAWGFKNPKSPSSAAIDTRFTSRSLPWVNLKAMAAIAQIVVQNDAEMLLVFVVAGVSQGRGRPWNYSQPLIDGGNCRPTSQTKPPIWTDKQFCASPTGTTLPRSVSPPATMDGREPAFSSLLRSDTPERHRFDSPCWRFLIPWRSQSEYRWTCVERECDCDVDVANKVGHSKVNGVCRTHSINFNTNIDQPVW